MNLLSAEIKHRSKSVSLRLSTLEFFFWAAFAAYYPMLVMFLQSKGYSNTTVGTIIAVNSIIVVVAQPLWGIVSDKLQSVKKVFVICLSTAVIMVQPLPFIDKALISGIILAVVTFFESPLMPLLDCWVIRSIKTQGNTYYGQIRYMGSLGFAIFVVIYGKIVDITSPSSIFVIFGIMAVFVISASLWVKTDKPVSSINFSDLKVGRLFKNYYYVTFIIFSAVLFVSSRAAFIFLPNMIKHVSGSTSQLGMTFSCIALSEIPFFLFSRKLLQRYRAISIILISSLFFILRLFLYTLVTTPLQVMLVNMLQGPSFGLYLSGAVYYVDTLAPKELKSTAMTLATSVFFGVSGIVGSYAGGWVIDNIGLMSLYSIGLRISISITVLFIISLVLGQHFKKLNHTNIK